MTTYQFWSGLKTIGGNIVEIRTDKARVLCDFGLSVAGQLSEETKGLSEAEYLIQTGNLPAIKNLYSRDIIKESKKTFPSTDLNLETSIFISHLHLDHMGGLRYLDKDVKVYLSEEAYKLYNELVKINEEVTVDCQLIPFSYNQSITVGDIIVSPKHSDHDSIGCSAFFIETASLKILHSGDFRLSGKYPERVLKWVEEARDWDADVLLIEGTSFSFREENELEQPEKYKTFTENTLLNEIKDLMAMNTDELFFYNPYVRNVERMFDVNTIVKNHNRTMVWEASYAQILHAFYPNEKWTILKETSSQEDDFDYLENKISLQQLIQNPGAYVLQNSFKNLQFLDYFNSGYYLHSNGEPLGDYDPRYAQLKGFLENQAIEFIALGASGHATQENLLKVAQLINAKNTVPWHTFNPETFYEAIKKRNLGSFIPEYNKEYII